MIISMSTPKKRGPKPKPPEDVRSVQFKLKLTPGEYAEISTAFDQPTVAARDLVVKSARRKLAKR